MRTCIERVLLEGIFKQLGEFLSILWRAIILQFFLSFSWKLGLLIRTDLIAVFRTRPKTSVSFEFLRFADLAFVNTLQILLGVKTVLYHHNVHDGILQ